MLEISSCICLRMIKPLVCWCLESKRNIFPGGFLNKQQKTTQVSTLSFGDTGLLVYVTGLEGNWPQIKRSVTDGETVKWQTKIL